MHILILGTTIYELIKARQGHLGWTMCTGSARITANLIEGKKPAIDLEGLTLDTL